MKKILLTLTILCIIACNDSDKKKGPTIEFGSDSVVIDAPVLIDSHGIHPKPNDYIRVNLGDALFYDSVKGIIYLDPKYHYDTIDWKAKYDSMIKRKTK